ncbi:MAG: 16S rRNA (uracil(1498)-N(3))-methyltransferase [Nannocystaceae bacterium]|nr:16S rRNA (uracil(1498)-N(3))-methyltransferase [Nannocystaceae bacterium]
MSLRVFHDGALVPGELVTLAAPEHHYLARVRRASAGDVVELLDGRAHAARATIATLDARRAVLRVGELSSIPEPPPLELWLALCDVDACLAAITMACELGVTAITWVRSAHAQARPPAPARVQRVVRAAMRQCGRPRPPEISGPVALEPLLADAAPAGGVIACQRHVQQSAAGPRVARLLVGPEGGFTDDEVQRCLSHGMHACSLGPWTLRAPTAVAAGLAWLRAQP